MSQHIIFCFFPFLLRLYVGGNFRRGGALSSSDSDDRPYYLIMSHLVLCYGIWTLIFTGLCLRLVAVIQQAIAHLKHLHQIPCDKCAYFTGDYRLKCTVNPTVAMSEEAIGCRDFLQDSRPVCKGCVASNHCSNNNTGKKKYSLLKRKSI